MRPQTFVDLLKQWLVDANSPGITAVHTCPEIGRWEQPSGLRITCDDGWALLVGMVRASPPGGDPTPPSKGFDPGRLEDREDYKRARAAADAAAAKVPRSSASKPQARVNALLGVVVDVVKRADHAGVTGVEYSSQGGRPPALRVSCVDGSTVFGLPVGWFAPGATRFSHDEYKIPEGWY